jgi:hypothetical protein
MAAAGVSRPASQVGVFLRVLTWHDDYQGEHGFLDSVELLTCSNVNALVYKRHFFLVCCGAARRWRLVR